MKDLPAIISWDEAWSVGLKEIDDDHKKLVHIIQRLFGVLFSLQESEYVGKIVTQLLDYTEYHFEHEEAILREKKYPDLDTHIQCHQELIEQVKSYCRLIQDRQ